MTALTRTISRVFPVASPQLGILKQIALAFGATLLVWLLIDTYGLDLSAGFF